MQELICMSGKRAKLKCVVCTRPVEGKPHVMRLHITDQEPKLIDAAKKLGFTSASWHAGDYMEGIFHTKCFNMAKLVWQIAFDTKPLSPRR